MWRARGKLSSSSLSSRRSFSVLKKNFLCGAKLRKVPSNAGQTTVQGSIVRHLSNNAAGAGRGMSAGMVILSASVVTAGTVIGGIYYAKQDPAFRKNVENIMPILAPVFGAILGKEETRASTRERTAFPQIPASPLNPSKDGSENQLLSSADQKVGATPQDGSSLQKSEMDQDSSAPLPPQVLPERTPLDNAPASISSVDQMAVSSVDLDISKAVEKGVSEAKKEVALEEEGAGIVSEDSRQDGSTSVKKKHKKKKKKVEKEEVKAQKEATGTGQEDKVDKSLKETPASDQTSNVFAETTALDISLQTTMATVSELGRKAIECHERAVAAVRLHRDSVKEALQKSEDMIAKGQWEVLDTLSEAKTKALEDAKEAAAKLSDLVEMVQLKITEAKEKGLVESAEVASETLAKLTYAVQQVKNTLKETQTEGTVLKQFQDMVEKGKQHLKEELDSITPHSQDSKLEDRADEALLAYAQKRIRLLEDALDERETKETQLLEEALHKQQHELEKLADLRLKHELEKLRTDLNDLMRQKEAETAELHENDLRQQLRRQAAAFSDHLSEVLKVQENALDMKYQGEMSEKLLLARQEFDLKLRGTVARLNGVIAAVENRAEIEKENNQAQELWLACQSLATAIIGRGDDSPRLYPIQNEVEHIRRVTDDNEVLNAVLDSLSEEAVKRGVFTEESIRRRFPTVRKVCKQVAMVGEEGGGVWSYLVSYLQSLFVFDLRASEQPSAVNPDDLDNYQLLDLAACSLEAGDTDQAVRYMNQLRGEPRRVAKDWIQEARLFLETRQVARFLISFASACNIGATG